MDVVEKLVGDEIVAHQPNEVGQEDQQRQGNSRPEPAAQDEPARTGEHNTGENPCNVKHHGIFGQQSQADYSTDGQPPARVLCFEQPDREVRDQHPPQVIEGRILKFRPFEKWKRRQSYGESRRDLGEAAAAQFLGHQPRDDDGRSLRND